MTTYNKGRIQNQKHPLCYTMTDCMVMVRMMLGGETENTL